ncbi:hypothetical protein CH373_09895 [Leptospira perolatii]|uniref:Uncharacterized protein n=1 Tax=Leptospira perolatii TaxID=2023191 RepID=A0A2M9ZMR5_9LEPT|nr:hypothetical protein [Leptospira perolatii]PJZ70093.1 hypothetical protein CH360_07640 [Leptospira perolatii]PJZ73281.1 hypothetical protein CH373_09895 [Leptospira perolatii]
MRRSLYLLLIWLQVAVIATSSTLDVFDHADWAKAYTDASSKKVAHAAIESNLRGSEKFILSFMRERDNRPFEIQATLDSGYPWSPRSYSSSLSFVRKSSYRNSVVSFLLVDLPPPSIQA